MVGAAVTAQVQRSLGKQITNLNADLQATEGKLLLMNKDMLYKVQEAVKVAICSKRRRSTFKLVKERVKPERSNLEANCVLIDCTLGWYNT